MKTKLPNYLPEVLRIHRNAPPGRVMHTQISHDEWCSQLKGTGPCDCDPIVRRVAGPPPGFPDLDED